MMRLLAGLAFWFPCADQADQRRKVIALRAPSKSLILVGPLGRALVDVVDLDFLQIDQRRLVLDFEDIACGHGCTCWIFTSEML